MLGVGVAVGRVVRFDGVRGYGFIAPESGGEDVFLHVNDLLIPESYVRAGLGVEFDVEEGDRGLKASGVRLAPGVEAPPVVPAQPRPAEGGDGMCDVLSAEEYSREMTEVLLESVQSLTAQQILQVRSALVQFGKSHGWVEG
ncbi:cold shock domain-containing protein [Streptomyces coacervatus]|uniref:Cold shock domain-containing protein n=1 Tax=Streptomyces coacervatus TaxID=647381 RepID=A0ABP7GRQ5_9ACTN